MSSSGVFSNDARAVASDVAWDAFNRRNPPQLAYEPNNRFILVPYRDTSNVLTGLLFHRDTTTTIATRKPLVQPSGSGWALRSSIAYYPATDGFMLTYQNTWDGLFHYSMLSHDALPWDGGPTGLLWSGLQSSARPLACPPLSASPRAVFPFEEVPGATAFEELFTSVAFASCSGGSCPQAGVEGVGTNGNTFVGVGNGSPPQTDNALLFDGINDRVMLPRYIGDDDFSISFWLKTDQVASSDNWYADAIGLVDADVANASNVFGIALGVNKVVFQAGSTLLSNPMPVADNNWHHVLASRNASTGKMYLVVDGSPAAERVPPARLPPPVTSPWASGKAVVPTSVARSIS